MPAVRRRLAITALLLGLAAGATPAAAQSLEEQLTEQFQEALQGGAIPGGESPVEPGVVPSEGDLPGATTPDPADTPAASTPDPAADLPPSPTPVPPPYLDAGPGATQQPVAAVAQLSDPDVALPPLRTAALLAPALALLLLALAGLLRASGLRTAAHEPIDVQPARGARRLGERTRQIADDMRDFLRRSR